MPTSSPITRRAMIAGTGLAATMALLPARAQAQTDGFRIIRAREFDREYSGREPTWRYDGTTPGPTLRIKRGEDLRVRLVSELSRATAIHWHGVRVPNAMDGTALTQAPIAPGASFDYRFTPPDAGTFWYHPPTRTRIERPLFGLLIVDEPQPVDVDRDVAIAVDSPWGKFTANGLSGLDIPVVANERIRLRLLNAADRFVTLRFDGHPMHVVAIDGQPAEPFLSRESRITLSPGNRADVFIDAVMKPGTSAPIMLQNEGVDLPLARLIYADTAPTRAAARTDVKPLPPNGLPAQMDFKGALRIDLDPNAGNVAAPPKPLFSAQRGRTIQLALKNRSEQPSVTHLHGHHARLLDALDDGWKPFWLDTILCAPQSTTRIAFVADNPGKWLLQSRAVGRDVSSLAWFEVT